MRRTSLQFALSLALIALLGAAGWWWLARHSAPKEQTFAEQVAQAKAANAEGLSPAAAQAASQAAAQPLANTFTAEGLGFTFGYPDSLKVGSFTDPGSGATTITAQDAATHVGFQIVVTPWGGGDISQQQIETDLAQVAPHGFTAAELGGVPAVAFNASDPNFGDSLQVWLARGGYLYQVSTYATQGALISKVLGSWQWQ